MNQNVLIIDDSTVDRMIMSRIIEKHIEGVTIFESDGERDANSLIREMDINVCILDLRMPNKDGFTILKE